jgi:hypothetical protein
MAKVIDTNPACIERGGPKATNTKIIIRNILNIVMHGSISLSSGSGSYDDSVSSEFTKSPSFR